MKKIIIMILISINLNANYILSYHDIDVGNIEDINTVKDDYIKIKVINSMAKIMLNSNNLIYHKIDFDKSIIKEPSKFKKDKILILEIIKKSVTNNLKEEIINISDTKKIEINKENENKFNFIYTSKNRISGKGYIILKNNNLNSIIDELNNVKIRKL